jgi:DNA-binding transcriptional LysR family regulator
MKHEVGTLGRRVDLNLMVVFDAVYRTRNLTIAGDRLGLSQPAMSHALSRLRSVFGDPLFVRMPRGLHPTACADEIAPAVAEGLAAIRGSFERQPFDPRKSTRAFTLGMADLAEVVQLPRLLRALRDAPGIRLRTVTLPPAQARAALAEGRLDLALSNVRVRKPFHEFELGIPPYATVARIGHPSIRDRLTLAGFRSARHLLVTPAAGGIIHGEAIERALRDPAVNADIAVQVSHFHSVATIVSESDLIATIPWGLAQAMAAHYRLRVFKPPIRLPLTPLLVIWHERYHRDPGNVWLRDLLCRVAMPLYGRTPPKTTLV